MTVRVSRALSVVIPAFDAAPWLPSTLVALAEAILRSGVDAEVIVVNDGSHDETVDVVEALASGYPAPLRVLSQENRGRFLARWAGAVAARHERLLLLDARVLVDPDALSYVGEHPEFEGIRVSPSVYSTLEEVDRFAEAMEAVLRNGLPGAAA